MESTLAAEIAAWSEEMIDTALADLHVTPTPTTRQGKEAALTCYLHLRRVFSQKEKTIAASLPLPTSVEPEPDARTGEAAADRLERQVAEVFGESCRVVTLNEETGLWEVAANLIPA